MFRGSPQGVNTFGLPCAGITSSAPRIGLRDLGGKSRVTVHDAVPGQPAVLLIGASRISGPGFLLPYPLDFIGLRGCQLYTSAQWALPITAGSSGIASGHAALDLPGRVSLGAGSVPVYAQWLAFTGGQRPAATSDAVEWSFR